MGEAKGRKTFFAIAIAAAILLCALALALCPGIARAQKPPPDDAGSAPAAEQPGGQE